MHFSIGFHCFLNYIFTHSWTSGTRKHMGHIQGKLISLTHWPPIILPQALKITAWCWHQVPSCTNPPQQGGKGGQQHWASPVVIEQFKTLMPFENATWSDQDMDMLYMPGVKWNCPLTENILLKLHISSLFIYHWYDAHPALGTLQGILESTVEHPGLRWGRGQTWERRPMLGLPLPPAKPSCTFTLW